MNNIGATISFIGMVSVVAAACVMLFCTALVIPLALVYGADGVKELSVAPIIRNTLMLSLSVMILGVLGAVIGFIMEL